jgi:hypothetical protein
VSRRQARAAVDEAWQRASHGARGDAIEILVERGQLTPEARAAVLRGEPRPARWWQLWRRLTAPSADDLEYGRLRQALERSSEPVSPSTLVRFWTLARRRPEDLGAMLGWVFRSGDALVARCGAEERFSIGDGERGLSVLVVPAIEAVLVEVRFGSRTLYMLDRNRRLRVRRTLRLELSLWAPPELLPPQPHLHPEWRGMVARLELELADDARAVAERLRQACALLGVTVDG